jgi:iron complex transport system ATP-binding protein
MKLELESIHQGYGNINVLKGIDLYADAGEVLALLGPNGSGKSTLIKTIAGILRPRSGRILVGDKDVLGLEPAEMAKMVGYVPQYFSFMPFTTVLDTVLIGRRPYMQWSASDEDLKVVERALDIMQISDLIEKNVNELSGGQRQRVFIARALTQSPRFYLFDEPTSSLDLRYQLETMDTMRKLVHKEGVGMLIALHDLNLALRYADKAVMIKNGSVHACGRPDEVITEETIKEVYGVEATITHNEHGRFILPYGSVFGGPTV